MSLAKSGFQSGGGKREEIVIERFAGAPSSLLDLFAQADDSAAEVAKYLEAGVVFIARRSEEIIGHVQIIVTGRDWEIKSVAVIETERGYGVGTLLIRTALTYAWSLGADSVLIATATADIGNLRFYQRLGFRMDHVERDVFTVERGYSSLEVDGIPIRDRYGYPLRLRGT